MTREQQVDEGFTPESEDYRLGAISPDEECKALRAQVKAQRKIIALLDEQLTVLLVEQSSLWSRAGRVLTRLERRLFPPGTIRGRGAQRSHDLARRVLSGGRSHRAGVSSAIGPGVSASPREYAEWIRAHEPDSAALARQRIQAAQLSYRPLISIITPVHEIPLDILKRTIGSVQDQTYDNWELCMTLSGAENSVLADYLKNLSKEDRRFKVDVLKKNGGISANSNRCLEMACGEFIALLDHDDELAPSALHEMAATLNRDGSLDFLYSDSDYIDLESRLRRDPFFKPEYSPETIFSANYLTHLTVIRRKIVQRVGGFRTECDGAQDWDLFLRVLERTRAIARVPGVLYHWRVLPGSASFSAASKPYVLLGQLHALNDHLEAENLDATLNVADFSRFKITWRIPENTALDLIVDGNAPEKRLETCVRSISRMETPVQFTTHVVLPPDSTWRPQGTRPDRPVHIIHRESGEEQWQAVNRVVSQGTGQGIVLLSGRIQGFAPGLLDELAGWSLCHPRIGFAGALILDEKGDVLEAGLVTDSAGGGSPLFRGSKLSEYGWFGSPLWYRNCSAVGPYAVGFSRRSFMSVGGFEGGADFTSSFVRFCGMLRERGMRGLVDPHARAHMSAKDVAPVGPCDASCGDDPYFHPAFSRVAPLRLKT
jgi:hypothetical protein